MRSCFGISTDQRSDGSNRTYHQVRSGTRSTPGCIPSSSKYRNDIRRIDHNRGSPGRNSAYQYHSPCTCERPERGYMHGARCSHCSHGLDRKQGEDPHNSRHPHTESSCMCQYRIRQRQRSSAAHPTHQMLVPQSHLAQSQRLPTHRLLLPLFLCVYLPLSVHVM